MLVRLLLLALVCQSQAQLLSYIPGVSYFFPGDQAPAQRGDDHALQAPEVTSHHQHQDPYPQNSHQQEAPQYTQPSHEDCIDEYETYGEVQYNITTVQHCSYSLDRICYDRSQVICLQVPITECKLEAGYTCETHEETNTLRCDTTVEKKTTVRDCVQDRFESLMKVQKTPECRNVTKVNCDSKWIINEYGQKVFDRNKNCRDYTWEECELVDKVVNEAEVPVYTCTDREEAYLVPEVVEEAVISYRKECETVGGAQCEVTTREECATVEWTDCQEVIRPHCEAFTVKIPFQEKIKYHRCHVDKDTGYQQEPTVEHHHHHESEQTAKYQHELEQKVEYHHESEQTVENHQHPEQQEYHQQPEQMNVYQHQPEQTVEHHYEPEQMIVYPQQPEQMTEYHQQPEQMIEHLPHPEQIHYHQEHEPMPQYHHQLEQMPVYQHQIQENTYRQHQSMPAQLGHHPNTEYHAQPITGYHHPPIAQPEIPSQPMQSKLY